VISAFLALALALAAPVLAQPIETRVRVSEAADESVLDSLCHLPQVQVELRTQSNMLGNGPYDAFAHCPAPWVQMRAPVLQPHRERLEKRPGVQPVFELAQDATLDWPMLAALGPRRFHVRVSGSLSAPQALALARLRNVEVELDLRGRVPEAAELARLRGLEHADRVVRLGPGTDPDLLPGLTQLGAREWVVESRDNRLPAPLLAALAGAPVPVRVSVTWPVLPADLEALAAALPRLRLELELPGAPRDLPRGLARALAGLRPARDIARPDGGFLIQIPEGP
jgi:hypothetical protein